MEAQTIADEKPFAAAEEKFGELVTQLSAVESRRMTHSELESLNATEGREIHQAASRVGGRTSNLQMWSGNGHSVTWTGAVR